MESINFRPGDDVEISDVKSEDDDDDIDDELEG
jgi:hypothetical protein